MGRLEIGDFLDPNEISEEYELCDWGEQIDGQYSYVLLDDQDDHVDEYLVVVDSYRVVKQNNVD